MDSGEGRLLGLARPGTSRRTASIGPDANRQFDESGHAREAAGYASNAPQARSQNCAATQIELPI